MIESGKMRERITLQSKVITRDALNGQVIAWTDEKTVYAQVDAISGREAHAADQLQNPVTLNVKIRIGPAVKTSWRALWGARVLSIEAVLPVPERNALSLLCSEGLSNA